MSISSITITLNELPTLESLSAINAELLPSSLIASLDPNAKGPFSIQIADDYCFISYSSPKPTLILSSSQFAQLKTDKRLDAIFQQTLPHIQALFSQLRDCITQNTRQIRIVSQTSAVVVKISYNPPNETQSEWLSFSIRPLV